MKTQAILFWIPGIEAYSIEIRAQIANAIKDSLTEYFEKPVTVVLLPNKIEFLSEQSIRELIDTLENVIK